VWDFVCSSFLSSATWNDYLGCSFVDHCEVDSATERSAIVIVTV
jgi:hypothetical protein